jgi:hypothetical protein
LWLKFFTKPGKKKLKGRDYLEYPGIDGGILNWIIMKQSECMEHMHLSQDCSGLV